MVRTSSYSSLDQKLLPFKIRLGMPSKSFPIFVADRRKPFRSIGQLINESERLLSIRYCLSTDEKLIRTSFRYAPTDCE